MPKPESMHAGVSRPHPNSYAVLDTGILAGEYPSTPNPGEARRKLRAYLDAGVDYFVDLTEDGELVPYESALEEEARAKGVAVDYVRVPIRDMDV